MKTRQNLTDSLLIRQYKMGNTDALPKLVKRYHKLFCEKAFWVTKDKDSAKDIAQESWITIIDKLDTLKDWDRFKGWALRIVYTKSIDYLKQQNRELRQKDSIPTEREDKTTKGEEQKSIHKVLIQAIHLLPKEKQDIIRLFYKEEYSIYEISTFLKIPIGTVKSRLFKAREKLKSIIKTQDYEK